MLVALAGPDADSLFHRQDENFAVAELTGPRGLAHGFDRQVGHLERHYHFDFDLWQKIQLILAAAIGFRMPFLAAESFDFGYRHSKHANFLQGILDRIQQMGPDNAFDLSHTASFIRGATLPRTSNTWVSTTGRNSGVSFLPSRSVT